MQRNPSRWPFQKQKTANRVGPSGLQFSKGDSMKKLLLGMMAIMMLVMSGCGGGSVEVVVPIGPSPPLITSYGFTKDTVREFVDGSVAFYAPDSDIDTMTVVVFNPRGIEISRTQTLINLPGTAHGTIPFSIDYAAFPSEAFAYTFSIYLTDFNGNTSSQAVDTFFVP
jgi:hypothetical protein